MSVTFQIKRAYDAPSESDGLRILIDRLWPRGISKADAHFDRWAKDLSPSNELRERFHHDASLWTEFCAAYKAELADRVDQLNELVDLARQGTVTLIYAAKDEQHNNAVALKEIIEEYGRANPP